MKHIITLLLALSFSSAWAFMPSTGNDLITSYTSYTRFMDDRPGWTDEDRDKAVILVVFINTVANTNSAIVSRMKYDKVAPGPGLVCIPNGVARRQVVDVTMQWLAKHPSTTHLPATPLIQRALSDTWPCGPTY